ncbi:uncharacterized protein K441DRAFT_575212 [Cenococcum geophilum 1.58]|uniref:uncharacterized protein n=1 Tax=Cenococcum geophilum 1.58 TaxID=794803 RepID=UPI00358FA19E|nr:hypothetical protein K441DRAFT_575212 [Cenococcum geophilum 1.58]
MPLHPQDLLLQLIWLAQSSRYDTAGKFKGDDEEGLDAIRDEGLTSFANASLLPTLIQYLFLDIITQQTPFFTRPLVTGTAISGFIQPEMNKMLAYLEEEPGDRAFFMDDKDPGRADFMLELPFALILQRKWGNLSEYPKLKRWSEACCARPAWKESLRKGIGYNLASFG